MSIKTLIKLRETQAKNSFSNKLSEELLEKNKNGFWKSWKSKFKSNKMASVIDGHTEPNKIADKFAEYFCKA